MTSNIEIQGLDTVEQYPLRQFTEQAYLEYSMYVILDRALPHVADGLKPVQRRIVYAMSELGLKSTAKYKKSARTVGDVLGKFHPHGDSACYEAMVLMAQSFSYRYPLVDGQGNWGSTDDPKSFAAMRYTEAKLSSFADILLSELGDATVDWVPNFDGTMEEPRLLPAQVPTVLLNGSSGIAVGMATDIPPHNLNEVVSACIHLLEKPDATIAEINKHIKAPDYPTDAEIITPKADIRQMYKTGSGSIRMRAVYEMEGSDVIITALPHQVSGAKILEQIAAQMHAKKLPMVEDLRDESDHENPTRLVIVPRSSRVDIESLMAHLFAVTDLERSYRVNMNAIGLDGRPRVFSLLEMLQEWLVYRTDTVKKRLQYRLDRINDRLHILEGLHTAFLNIDEVIKIIRENDDPKVELMKQFKLSDLQAEAILNLKLRHLAKLEEMQLKSEQDALNEEREGLEKILGSKTKLKNLIVEELQAIAQKHGDKRRSPLVEREEAKAISETEMLPSEPVTVILSQKGWVRSAKGHDVDVEGLSYKSGDAYLASAKVRSNQLVVFFDSTGRSYSLLPSTLPSARGQGEPLTGRVKPAPGTSFVGVVSSQQSPILIASSAGYGFITQTEEALSKMKAGKAMLKCPKGTKALPPLYIKDKEHQQLAAATNEGRLLLFSVSDLPELTKGKGNKIIGIPSARAASGEEFVVGIALLEANQGLRIYSGKRHIVIKSKDLLHYVGERGRRGNKLPRGFQRVTAIMPEE